MDFKKLCETLKNSEDGFGKYVVVNRCHATPDMREYIRQVDEINRQRRMPISGLSDEKQQMVQVMIAAHNRALENK